MKLMSREFGPSVWPLLYQTDVRCRSERMPLLCTQLVTAHEADLLASKPSSFDTSRPWDSVFDHAISSQKSIAWWNKEFERPALLIITRSANMSSMIEGDAVVDGKPNKASSSSASKSPSRRTTKSSEPKQEEERQDKLLWICLLYTSPSPRD